MYCRSCGALLDGKAEICVKCGCRPEKGTEYCPKCGARAREKQAVCTICGYGLDIQSFYNSIDIDFSTPLHSKTLSKYYQKEFQRIYDSKEAYKGKFNICAFLFGPMWALVKGCILQGLLSIAVCFLLPGLGMIISAIYFGVRGNYMYYYSNLVSRRVEAWHKVTDSKN